LANTDKENPMTIHAMTLPPSLKDEVEAARSFRAALAFAEREHEPTALLAEIGRLREEAGQSAHAAAWLMSKGKGLATFAKPCAKQALAAACAAALLAARLPAGTTATAV
jgi:hypothetical protein